MTSVSTVAEQVQRSETAQQRQPPVARRDADRQRRVGSRMAVRLHELSRRRRASPCAVRVHVMSRTASKAASASRIRRAGSPRARVSAAASASGSRGGTHQAGAFVLDERARAADRRRDDGQTLAHRFDDDHAEPFIGRRPRQDVVRPIRGHDLCFRYAVRRSSRYGRASGRERRADRVVGRRRRRARSDSCARRSPPSPKTRWPGTSRLSPPPSFRRTECRGRAARRAAARRRGRPTRCRGAPRRSCRPASSAGRARSRGRFRSAG